MNDWLSLIDIIFHSMDGICRVMGVVYINCKQLVDI